MFLGWGRYWSQGEGSSGVGVEEGAGVLILESLSGRCVVHLWSWSRRYRCPLDVGGGPSMSWGGWLRALRGFGDVDWLEMVGTWGVCVLVAVVGG